MREGREEREREKKKKTIRSQRHDFLGMSNYRGSMLNKGLRETMAGIDRSSFDWIFSIGVESN